MRTMFANRSTRIALFAAIAISCWSFALAENAKPTRPVPAPKSSPVARLPAEHLPNLVRLNRRVYSGGLPEGAAGFRELQELGVRTVISVDGITPDVATAKQFGLTYVHIPHGYDGIPRQTAMELAKAVSALPGPVYIHCHHGKNRSPAAAAVGCVGAGFLTAEEAVEVLNLAGTSKHYSGLYQAARTSKPIDPQRLAKIPADFPEIAEIPPMAEAMVEIAHIFERMKQVQAANWKTPPKHPDIAPAHEALILREQFTELLRTEDVKQRPTNFRKFLKESEQAGFQLEKALREPQSPQRAKQALQSIANNCKTCHEQFRNVSLIE